VRSGPKESLAISIFASVCFIIWGQYVNWEYGPAARWQVAITQGAVSFFSTLFSAELLRFLFKRMPLGIKLRLWFCPVLGWLLLSVFVVLAHVLAGTPELWNTVWPGAITGLMFSVGYCLRLGAEERKLKKG